MKLVKKFLNLWDAIAYQVVVQRGVERLLHLRLLQRNEFVRVHLLPPHLLVVRCLREGISIHARANENATKVRWGTSYGHVYMGVRVWLAALLVRLLVCLDVSVRVVFRDDINTHLANQTLAVN